MSKKLGRGLLSPRRFRCINSTQFQVKVCNGFLAVFRSIPEYGVNLRTAVAAPIYVRNEQSNCILVWDLSTGRHQPTTEPTHLPWAMSNILAVMSRSCDALFTCVQKEGAGVEQQYHAARNRCRYCAPRCYWLSTAFCRSIMPLDAIAVNVGACWCLWHVIPMPRELEWNHDTMAKMWTSSRVTMCWPVITLWSSRYISTERGGNNATTGKHNLGWSLQQWLRGLISSKSNAGI